MRVYHYRSIERALQEIENGTFHFSSQEELNDPIEGYVKLYWQGDEAAWEGLFQNYICSLYRVIGLYQLGVSYDRIVEQAVVIDKHQWDNVPFGKDLQEVARKFVEEPSMQKIIGWLGNQNIRFTEHTLNFLLRLIHETAYTLCIQKMKDRKLVPHDFPEGTSELSLEEFFKRMPIESLDQVRTMNDSEEKALKEILGIVVSMLEDHIEYRILSDMMKENSSSQFQLEYKLRFDFPSVYVRRLNEIVYPKGYVVCFSADNDNSVMWGNYACNHKGVCLIYQTEQKNDQEVMSIKNQMTYGSAGMAWSFRNNTLRPVQYEKSIVERNFFVSLGRLTLPQICSFMETETKGMSKTIDTYYSDNWRAQYWEDQLKKYHSKMGIWEYEHEYRFFMDEGFHQFANDERNISYDRKHLKGVVFGIKTSIQDKARILNAFKGAGMKDYEIYQAEYDNEKQKIRIRKKYELVHLKSNITN